MSSWSNSSFLPGEFPTHGLVFNWTLEVSERESAIFVIRKVYQREQQRHYQVSLALELFFKAIFVSFVILFNCVPLSAEYNFKLA